jgi:hypothetical protein
MPLATPVLPTLASYNFDETDLVEFLLPILQKEVVEGVNQYYFDIVESLAVPFRLSKKHRKMMIGPAIFTIISHQVECIKEHNFRLETNQIIIIDST